MILVSGRVEGFLRDSGGQLKSLQLEHGREIQVPAELASQVSSILTEGCSVAIEGVPRSEKFPESCLLAILVTNLDSNETATLPALKHKGKPGMQTSNTPVETASLAPPRSQGQELAEQSSLPSLDLSIQEPALFEGDPAPLHPGSFFRAVLKEDSDAKSVNSTRNDSARSIGLAYDSLHRIQAVLAYLYIMKHRVPGISQFLDEAKHTYVQALSRFASADFISAKEFAEASFSLSRVVEIVMARTLRSDSTLPSLVPPPPEHLSFSPEPDHIEEDLAQAESVLSRIHWILDHGTLPSDDRAQVRRIASWGDAFFKQAKRTYREAVLEDASEFAQAALAGAYSAEHVCRKWYVHHPVHP